MVAIKWLGLELKKLIVQKEIYIALVLCTIIFAIALNAAMLDIDPFWKNLTSSMPYIGYWFVASIVVVTVARLEPFDREQQMQELLYTYKKGYLQLLVIKQVILLLSCIGIVSYFFIAATLILYIFVDSPSMSIFSTIAVAPTFYLDVPEQWTFIQLLLFEYVYSILTSFIFALVVFLLAFFCKRSVVIMLVAGSLFALGELYRRTGIYNYWLSFYDFYGLNGMLGFRYVQVPMVMSELERLQLFGSIALLLFILNLIVGRWRKYALA